MAPKKVLILCRKWSVIFACVPHSESVWWVLFVFFCRCLQRREEMDQSHRLSSADSGPHWKSGLLDYQTWGVSHFTLHLGISQEVSNLISNMKFCHTALVTEVVVTDYEAFLFCLDLDWLLVCLLLTYKHYRDVEFECKGIWFNRCSRIPGYVTSWKDVIKTFFILADKEVTRTWRGYDCRVGRICSFSLWGRIWTSSHH